MNVKPPTFAEVESGLPPLSEKEIEECYQILTNGGEDIPYAVEHGDGEWSIRVADDIPTLTVPRICDPEGYAAHIAWAVCMAGQAIRQLREQRTDVLREAKALLAKVDGLEWVSRTIAREEFAGLRAAVAKGEVPA